ncbi:MAG TPA: MarR family winged helix-turn-helix transcriptional regulator [Thermotogota bacterium]|nr:MarR family winged helix-turn-helix transcriptional regulator [Thermotogota bacterium]HRW35308.1 MarR family winged helix-turn-helix transcriptional regulator [Thermotogota bacterium]
MNTLNQMQWLLRIYSRMHRNVLTQKEEKNGLSEASHPAILFILRYDMKEMKASQKEIADEIGISPSTVAISIKRMEKAGLLKKVQDKDDLRKNLITLTEKGLEFTNRLHDISEEVDQGIFSGFSEDELEELKGYYKRMIRNLERMGAKTPAFLQQINIGSQYSGKNNSD